ncbi:MAG: NAD-dependent epimerase/dehydratase family protein [Bacteroidales bacterium]
MEPTRQVVLLTGASGSMGFEAFRLLWEMRDRYDLVLLVRPSGKNKKKFRPYERMAGITPFRGPGVARGEGLKIVWGDALDRQALEEAARGIDWCLHTMALISPAADRDPEMARKVNTEATRQLVKAIESNHPERTHFVHIGSVAMYGDRLPPIHVGRTGDPMLPSVYDHYAISKINAELAVMESRIRYRVSLRQTFIMIPDLFSLMDPIMFHQPIHSMMENITARDAGRLLVRCLDIPDESDFWGSFYNISGGPGCRITFLEFMDRIYRLLGIDYRHVMKRNWFALKNFHMQFFEDADRLNRYLQHWEGGQQMEDYFREVWTRLPRVLKITAWCNKRCRPFRWLVERGTRIQLGMLTRRKEGTMHWIRHREQGRIEAFFGSTEVWKNIPGWDTVLPDLDHTQPFRRLSHGFDESKPVPGMEDLRQAADFRGGELESPEWSGDMDQPLSWRCCQQHQFTLTPRSVLLGGHWCMECLGPPWDYHPISEKNQFAGQMLGEEGISLAAKGS